MWTSTDSAQASTCSPSTPTRPSGPASRASNPQPSRCRSSVSKTERLFGTDGVRSKAGHYPLDPPTVRRLGAALVRALPHGGTATSKILVGRDTRESGAWIEAELTQGAAAAGPSVTSDGVGPS